MDKNKIFKVLFIISFLPYVVLILISIYYSIFGYNSGLMFSSPIIYGIEAFGQSLFWNSLTLCFIPILPIVLIYQIVYVIIKVVKKNKTKMKDKRN